MPARVPTEPAALLDWMVGIRRALHRHPELSGRERRTAARVREALAEIGVKGARTVGGTGVLAELPGPAGVPAVVLRADLDALPIAEETGLPFASEVPGVMHACGHDGHTAMLLGATALLAADEALPAPVRLLWQPAEETGRGAPPLVAEGVLDGAGAIFGGHVDRRYDAGTVVVTEGPVNASTDTFRIVVAGRDAHGARPHESVDSIVVGSLLVMAIQTIVSREVAPAWPAVVSVGSFHAGAAPNVIAGRAVLEGTIRAQHPTVRAHLREAIDRIARSVGQLHGARVEVALEEGTPPLLNRPGPTALARRAAERVADRVEPLHTANMGGEDFAFYLERVPGCYVRFGARIPGREGFPAHSSRFDFDEAALATGAAWFAEVARIAGERLAAGEPIDPPDAEAAR